MKKWLVVLLIVLLLAAGWFLDTRHWLTFESLQAGQASLQALCDHSPILALVIYFVVYVTIAALSLPGALIMSLAGGALFGLWWGTLLVSFSSSLGALLAFLVSRYLLRDTVQSRFGNRLTTINDGIARDGGLYLFSLRLVPVFPFFLINLLMGLTPIPATRFYFISQLGMLPATFVYVNAGTQLAQLNSVSDLYSGSILTAFGLLALLPWLAKTILEYWRNKKVYARWSRPAKYDRNLIVIGAGAAGLVSAYIAATVKAKVTLIESHKMGGDCLNYGCVPSKTLIKSARVAHQLRHADQYGLQAGNPQFSFRQIMARVQHVIREIEPHDSIARYTGLGVEVLQGHARLLDPWTVEIRLATGETQRLTTRSIVLATGAQPFVPPIPGLDQTGYLTSDTVWNYFATQDAPPARLLILGGGPIGCELAQAMARLGSQVTQIEKADRLLLREDIEVSSLVEKTFAAEGITVLTGHQAVRCEVETGEKYLVVEQHGQTHRIGFDALICAVGRVPRLSGYGLEELGMPVKGTVTTNDYLQTLYPNIYAAGDVAGPYQFTHTAAHQAWHASVNALFGALRKFRVEYRVIPSTTFTDPELARVGLNEQEANSKGIAYEITRYPMQELDRAIADSVQAGFIKVLTVPGTDRILGVSIAGEQAGERLAEFVLAIRWGLGLNKILSTIHTYPTLSEANKNVAGLWKRNHAPQKVLHWLERYHRWRRQ